MSFLTEYFDEYRQHPIRKTVMCRPEQRWASLDGKWLDPKVGTQEKEWTDEEVQAFIKATMRRLRGQSTYYNDYCGHLSSEFKTRAFEPRDKNKKRKLCADKATEVEEATPQQQMPKLALQDTELMKVAKELYEGQTDKPTLKPLPTHLRTTRGYCRQQLYKTGISDYQGGIARLAYEMVRDDRVPRYRAANGCRPRWGLPPDDRQPPLDGAPFDGERLY